VALPFSMKDQQLGVFFLRTTGEDPPLTRADAQFAETVIRTAVAAIEKAYDFETAVSDKKRLEKLAATDALTGCFEPPRPVGGARGGGSTARGGTTSPLRSCSRTSTGFKW